MYSTLQDGENLASVGRDMSGGEFRGFAMRQFRVVDVDVDMLVPFVVLDMRWMDDPTHSVGRQTSAHDSQGRIQLQAGDSS